MQALNNGADEKMTRESETSQYLTFMLAGKSYGLDILSIREIIEYGDVTEVPTIPNFISGVINVRGKIVPVIDLSYRFTGNKTEITNRTSIIILEVTVDNQNIETGVIVDMVNEVLDIRQSQIEPAPSLGHGIKTDFIIGMAKVDERLLILLDIENVLSSNELSQVGYIQDNTES